MKRRNLRSLAASALPLALASTAALLPPDPQLAQDAAHERHAVRVDDAPVRVDLAPVPPLRDLVRAASGGASAPVPELGRAALPVRDEPAEPPHPLPVERPVAAGELDRAARVLDGGIEEREERPVPQELKPGRRVHTAHSTPRRGPGLAGGGGVSAVENPCAFPLCVPIPNGAEWNGGMSLRDYVAAHAPTAPGGQAESR